MKLKHISLLLLFPLVLGACKKEIELEDPQGLDPEIALSNDANIKKVLQGGYNAISSANLYGGNIQMLSDLLASDGELTWVGTFSNYREIWGKNIITTNTLVSGMWIDAYSAINIANNVLANIDKVNEDDRDMVKGEALFIRASMHFELVRFFAKDYTDGDPGVNPGIPLMTSPVNSSAEVTTPARNTVSEVYTSVIADLTEAEDLLPESNGVFASKSAAATILARAALQKGDYATARDAADRGINNAIDNYLLDDFMTNFNQGANTPEDIFAIQVSDQDGANNLQVFYSVDVFGGRDGDIEINDKHIELYPAGDLRAEYTEDPEDASFNTAFYTMYGAYRTTKWRDLYKNPKVIRLSELYLVRAEANFRLGTALGATPLEDYNRVHSGSRTSLDEATSITLDDIYTERRIELAFEGFGIHDARRFKRTVDGEPWNSNKLVFPIPFRELNANKSLVQNPGY